MMINAVYLLNDLPFQGASLACRLLTQGVALGWIEPGFQPAKIPKAEQVRNFSKASPFNGTTCRSKVQQLFNRSMLFKH